MHDLLLTNALIFDGDSPQLQEGHVRIAQDRIVEISATPLAPGGARTVDLRGRFLMPGLIDAHVHVCCLDVDERKGDRMPASFIAQRARVVLEASLQRGFTCVRDTGGADRGLHLAIECGWIRGPRLFYCGRALSQTGGHGDLREPGEAVTCGCGTGYHGHLARVVDGADALRLAIREELRMGAHFIKVLASGGVASPTGALQAAQYCDEEIRAAVDEANRHGVYVAAHAHPDAAIRRCIELGVHCIEHGTLIGDQTARLAAASGTAVVPTLAVMAGLRDCGESLGFPTRSMAKLAEIEPLALQSLETLARAGVQIGFGTDLIGQLHDRQCDEFALRRPVLSALQILRSATSVNATILRQGHQLGRVRPGYLADLIVVTGNPLEDPTVFTNDGRNVPVVIKGGELLKMRL